MNKLLCITLVSIFLIKTVSAETKVLVVDVQKIIAESIPGKSARNNVEATVKREGEKLKQLEESFKQLAKEFEKQASLLSGTALTEKQEQLRKKERDLANLYEDQKRNLEIKNRDEIGKVVEQIDKIIKSFAKEKGYDFVLEKDPRVVVYAQPNIDLTEEIIEAVNEQKLDS